MTSSVGLNVKVVVLTDAEYVEVTLWDFELLVPSRVIDTAGGSSVMRREE